MYYVRRKLVSEFGTDNFFFFMYRRYNGTPDSSGIALS